MAAFRHRIKVLFQHCDPAGIVFFPRYFEMVNATVEEWFGERLGVPFAAMHGPLRGGVPTARLAADFHAPSRLGDVLEFALRPRRLGQSSCEIVQHVACGGEARMTVSQTLVWISMDTGRSRPWPDELRARIERDLEAEGNEP